MNPVQEQAAAALSPEQRQAIDDALLQQVTGEWRKIARVVGIAMQDQQDRVEGIPDIYYAQRLRHFVDDGRLEAQGNIGAMGSGEVRFASAGGKKCHLTGQPSRKPTAPLVFNAE